MSRITIHRRPRQTQDGCTAQVITAPLDAATAHKVYLASEYCLQLCLHTAQSNRVCRASSSKRTNTSTSLSARSRLALLTQKRASSTIRQRSQRRPRLPTVLSCARSSIHLNHLQALDVAFRSEVLPQRRAEDCEPPNAERTAELGQAILGMYTFGFMVLSPLVRASDPRFGYPVSGPSSS